MKLAEVISIQFSSISNQFTLSYKDQALYSCKNLIFCLRLIGAKIPYENSNVTLKLNQQDKLTLDLIFGEEKKSVIHDVTCVTEGDFVSLCVHETFEDETCWHGFAIEPHSKDIVFYKGSTAIQAAKDMFEAIDQLEEW